MEALEQIVSILSSTIGVGVGVVALLQRWWSRNEERPQPPGLPAEVAPGGAEGSSHQVAERPAAGESRLTSYRDETALAKARQPRFLRPFFLVGGSAWAIPATMGWWQQDFGAGLVYTVFSVLYFYMAHAAGRARSPTLKTASLAVELPVDDVMQRSHDVMRSIGLKITSFDLGARVINARRGGRLPHRQVITVKVESEGPSRSRIAIESDTVVTLVRNDWGANQRNVDLFVNGLLRY